MKLLVIVLCLFFERYLVHVSSHHRFHWSSIYGNLMEKYMSRVSFLSSPWLMLIFALFPMIFGASLVFYLFEDHLFGFVGLVLNLIVFYCCIGPGNPFYPAHASNDNTLTEEQIGTYLSQINGQIFAIIFWYIVAGPVGILIYRLISLAVNQEAVRQQAISLINILDWLPVRMTALLYLIVGNFQAALHYFRQSVWLKPIQNQVFLSTCGLKALSHKPIEDISMPHAEHIVEHAVIALLVLFACFTLVAWM